MVKVLYRESCPVAKSPCLAILMPCTECRCLCLIASELSADRAQVGAMHIVPRNDDDALVTVGYDVDPARRPALTESWKRLGKRRPAKTIPGIAEAQLRQPQSATFLSMPCSIL